MENKKFADFARKQQQTENRIIFRASTHQDYSNELSFVKFRIEEGGKRDRTFKKKSRQRLSRIYDKNANF